mmetsp:Transcript_25612/g.73070  ORF Transcript_25612/g.73070 Transcript_25612/m.73070 type:complete len:335 (+) Transcript_25612:1126-2130(+)
MGYERLRHRCEGADEVRPDVPRELHGSDAARGPLDSGGVLHRGDDHHSVSGQQLAGVPLREQGRARVVRPDDGRDGHGLPPAQPARHRQHQVCGPAVEEDVASADRAGELAHRPGAEELEGDQDVHREVRCLLLPIPVHRLSEGALDAGRGGDCRNLPGGAQAADLRLLSGRGGVHDRHDLVRPHQDEGGLGYEAKGREEDLPHRAAGLQPSLRGRHRGHDGAHPRLWLPDDVHHERYGHADARPLVQPDHRAAFRLPPVLRDQARAAEGPGGVRRLGGHRADHHIRGGTCQRGRGLLRDEASQDSATAVQADLVSVFRARPSHDQAVYHHGRP